MGLEGKALTVTDNLPIRHDEDVHSGKVRSVYWLTPKDSRMLIERASYDVCPDSQLGALVISDRISAFDCIWQAEDGLQGVPGKGAALNAISMHWFNEFASAGLARSHVLDVPHPLVWIVQKAEPVKVEAVARDYITGSMLRDYKKGVRDFCGNVLPEGLRDNQRLGSLLITPTTKGVVKGVPGVPEEEDTNLTRQQILDNSLDFGFKTSGDVDLYEHLLRQGFDLIRNRLDALGQIFVDTKFEFGYMRDARGDLSLGYIDEIGTPDSSRFWDKAAYSRGQIVENSKEGFRQFLLGTLDKDILLKKDRFGERKQLAANYRVPVAEMMKVSETYRNIAEKITGKPLRVSENPREEILDVISTYGLAA